MKKNIFLILSCLIISSFLHGKKAMFVYMVAKNVSTNFRHAPFSIYWNDVSAYQF